MSSSFENKLQNLGKKFKSFEGQYLRLRGFEWGESMVNIEFSHQS